MGYGSQLIREARKRARLSQRELAERAGTSQPAIARLESGRHDVGIDEVARLIALCGLELEVAVVPADDSDIAQARRLEELSPQDRLDRHQRLARQLRTLRAING